jgi:O-antigen ligase
VIAVARFLWMSLLILVPLTIRTPESGLAGTGRVASYLWTDGLVALVVFLVLLDELMSRRRASSPPGAGRTVLLLFVVLFEVEYVSLLAAMARGDAMSVSYLGAGVVWLRALAVFVVARRLVRDPIDVQRLWGAFLVAYVVVCGISLLELARNAQVTALLNTYYGTTVHQEAARHLADIGEYRVTATFDRNPHGLALYMMMGIAVITSVMANVRGIRGPARLALIGLLGVGVTVLLVTSSVLALLGTVASVVSIAVARRRHRIRRGVVLGGLLVGAGFVAAWRLQTTTVRLATAIIALRTGDVASVSLLSFTERVEMWVQALALMGKTAFAPLFGVGPAVLVQAVRDTGMYADNDYLFVLFATGALGLLAFLALLAACLVELQRRLRACPAQGPGLALVMASRGALLGLAVAALGGPFFTSEAFWRDSYMLWTLLGIAFASGAVGPYKPAPPGVAARGAGSPGTAAAARPGSAEP